MRRRVLTCTACGLGGNRPTHAWPVYVAPAAVAVQATRLHCPCGRRSSGKARRSTSRPCQSLCPRPGGSWPSSLPSYVLEWSATTGDDGAGVSSRPGLSVRGLVSVTVPRHGHVGAQCWKPQVAGRFRQVRPELGQNHERRLLALAEASQRRRWRRRRPGVVRLAAPERVLVLRRSNVCAAS